MVVTTTFATQCITRNTPPVVGLRVMSFHSCLLCMRYFLKYYSQLSYIYFMPASCFSASIARHMSRGGITFSRCPSVRATVRAAACLCAQAEAFRRRLLVLWYLRNALQFDLLLRIQRVVCIDFPVIQLSSLLACVQVFKLHLGVSLKATIPK